MYSFSNRVRYSEVNSEKELTLPSLLDYLQDCCTFESEDFGVGVDYLAKEQVAWILSSWEIKVYRYPQMGQHIKVSTWPYAFRGFYGYRNFCIEGEDGEIFAEVNTFNHGIDHERFDSKTEQRKQACADIEYKRRGKCDERIADEQRFADIKTRVLFEDHRNNIRAAARSVAVKEDRRADRRQHHAVAQLEERLIGKRLGKRNDLFKQPRQKRKQHAAIHGKHTKTAS